MLHRGVALVGLFALSPAHATLIDHSFTSTAAYLGADVDEDFGVWTGDTIAGGFPFRYARPRAHYPALWSLQTYGLQTRGHDQQARGDLVAWADFCLSEPFSGSLSGAGLQVPDVGALNRWFEMPFTDGSSADTKTSTSVPEPATLTLLGAGLLGAWAARRRRRDAAT